MPTTNLCHVSNDGILVRDRDLVNDIMGRMTFTEAFFLLLTGRNATPGEARIVDTVLITLMEHGLTPQAIATRLIYLSAPESLQGAMAAGLLGIGGQFAGTMEGAAKLLEEIVAAGADGEKTAKAIVSRYLTSKKAFPASATGSTSRTIRARREYWRSPRRIASPDLMSTPSSCWGAKSTAATRNTLPSTLPVRSPRCCWK